MIDDMHSSLTGDVRLAHIGNEDVECDDDGPEIRGEIAKYYRETLNTAQGISGWWGERISLYCCVANHAYEVTESRLDNTRENGASK